MLILISSIICYWITVQSIYILCWLTPPSNSVPSLAGSIVIEHHHSRPSRRNRLIAVLLLLLTIVATRYSTIVLMVIRIVVDRCAMDVTRCIRLGRLCPCIVGTIAGALPVGRSVGQLVVVIVVEVALTATPRLLLLLLLRTDFDATRFVTIALGLAIGVRLAAAASRSVISILMMIVVDGATTSTVLVVLIVVVVVVVRAKVPILLRRLLLVVPCPGGIVVARAQNRRRMLELVGVVIATPISPVLLRWDGYRARRDGRRSALLPDDCQRRLLLFL